MRIDAPRHRWGVEPLLGLVQYLLSPRQAPYEGWASAGSESSCDANAAKLGIHTAASEADEESEANG